MRVTATPLTWEPMWQLTSAVRFYPWGSRTVIPELLGLPSPADRPYAELWMGAHPDEPSLLADGRPLDAAIAADPERLLGTPVAERFGARLPFLLKVLAADQPLSLQAHPTSEQAQAGFAAEEAAGIPHDDADPHLQGPLPQARAAAGADDLRGAVRLPAGGGVAALPGEAAGARARPTIAALARGGLRAGIPQLLALSGERRTELVGAVAAKAASFVAAHDPRVHQHLPLGGLAGRDLPG